MEQTPFRQTYTPEQRNEFASRAMSDARLVAGGAEYDEYGRLEATPDQRRGANQEMYKALLADAEEKLKDTPSGQAIAIHRKNLDVLYETTKPSDYAADMDLVGDRELVKEWAQNELDLNLEQYDYEDLQARNTIEQYIVNARAALDETTLILSEFPQLQLDHEVIVWRNGNPPHAEAGWTVEGIRGSGMLQVASPPSENVMKVMDAYTLAHSNGLTPTTVQHPVD